MIDYVRLEVNDSLRSDIEGSDISVRDKYFTMVHHDEHDALVIHEPGLELVSSFRDVLLRFVPDDALTYRVTYDIVVNYAVSVKSAFEKAFLTETDVPRTAKLSGATVGSGNLAIIIYGLTSEEVLAIKLALQKSK